MPALMHATGNATLPFVERVIPGVDGELALPLILFAPCAALAWLLVVRAGAKGLELAEE